MENFFNEAYRQQDVFNQDARQRAFDTQHLAMGNIALQQAQMRQQDQMGLRNALTQGASMPQIPDITPGGMGSGAPSGVEIPGGAMPGLGSDPDKVEFDYWRTRDPDKAAAVAQRVERQAKMAADLSGDPQEAVKVLNEKLGMNFKFGGMKGSLIQVKDDNGQVHLIEFDPHTREIKERMTIGEPKGVAIGPEQSIVNPISGEVIYKGGEKSKASEEQKLAYETYGANLKPPLTPEQLDPNQKTQALLDYDKKKSEANRRPEDQETRDLKKALLELSLTQKKQQILSDSAIDEIAMALVTNKMAPDQMSMLGRSSSRALVIAKAIELDPNFNFAQAESNYVYGRNQQTQTVVRRINVIDNTLNKLRSLAQKMNQNGIVTWNKAEIIGRKELGDVTAATYDQMRTLLVEELGQVFAGGNAMSDRQLALANELLLKGATVPQMLNLLNQLQDRVNNKKDEMVQGTYMQSGGNAGNVPAKPHPDEDIPVGTMRPGKNGKNYRYKGGGRYNVNNWEPV